MNSDITKKCQYWYNIYDRFIIEVYKKRNITDNNLT